MERGFEGNRNILISTKMLIRTEKIQHSTNLVVIDENDKYLGDISREHFMECVISCYTININDYEYWTVNKELLIKYCKK